MHARFKFAILVCLCCAAAAPAATLTLGPGVVNPPPNARAPNGAVAVADTAALTGTGNLAATLTAQGFTPANGWNYSTMALANNANFNVTAYTLFAVGNTFSETMSFTLGLGATVPPAGGTAHFIQLVNYYTRPGFGYQLAGQPGWWFIDNWMTVGGGAAGPFYDSNALPGQVFSTPPNFTDTTSGHPAQNGVYVHFWTFEAWDVPRVGGGHNLIVGTPGITWGFVVVPEPGVLELTAVAALALALLVWRRRSAVAPPAPLMAA